MNRKTNTLLPIFNGVFALTRRDMDEFINYSLAKGGFDNIYIFTVAMERHGMKI